MVAFSVLVLLVVAVRSTLSRDRDGDGFLRTIFLYGLLGRVGIALVVFTFSLQEFFGGDAVLYDLTGAYIAGAWRQGETAPDWIAFRYLDTAVSGWGMHYWVGTVYYVLGSNPLAAQFINCVIGALVPIVIFQTSEIIFENTLVSRRAALLSAYFPSMMLWSAQELKDPIILLALCVVVYVTAASRRSLSVGLVLLGLGALFVLYSMRFYVFYIMAISVAMSVLLGYGKSIHSGGRQALLVVVIGTALAYAGVGGQAVEHLETIDLKDVQHLRAALALDSSASFGSEIDVSKQGGVLAAVPIGIVYLLLAPFPWQLSNLRQAVTLPEMVLWWSLLPMLWSGIRYSVKYRLVDTSSILIFTGGLLFAYSLFLSNVGTAYRQRSQLLVFFFMFIAVGLTLRTERRSEKNSEQVVVQPPAVSDLREVQET